MYLTFMRGRNGSKKRKEEGDDRPLPVLRGNWSSLAPDSFCLLFRLLAEDDRALIKQTRTRTTMMLTLTPIPAKIPVVRDSMMDSEAAETRDRNEEK